MLASVAVEDTTRRLATLAGEALGLVPSLRPDIGTIDGIVLTSAWLRGDTIYTSDVADLRAIQSRVPAFAALAIRAA